MDIKDLYIKNHNNSLLVNKQTTYNVSSNNITNMGSLSSGIDVSIIQEETNPGVIEDKIVIAVNPVSVTSPIKAPLTSFSLISSTASRIASISNEISESNSVAVVDNSIKFLTPVSLWKILLFIFKLKYFI